MIVQDYMPAAERWAGWVETPPTWPGWSASPIMPVEVDLLQTDRLRIAFLQPLAPRGGARREVVLEVLERGPHHLVGCFEVDGERHLVRLSPFDRPWFDEHCPDLALRRMWPVRSGLAVNGTPVPGPTGEEYLRQTFGRSPVEIEKGAHSRSFGSSLEQMPGRHAVLPLGVELSERDSTFAARGCVPHAMEEKWFVFSKGGSLRFHRSWTGILIYDVETSWRGDRLCLEQARANRDLDQYRETDDRRDRDMLLGVIENILLGSSTIASGREAQPSLFSWATLGPRPQR